MPIKLLSYLCIFLIPILAACGSHSTKYASFNHSVEATLTNGHALYSKAELKQLPQPDVDLFTLNDEMINHLRQHNIAELRSKNSKINQIVESLLGPDNQDMVYNPAKTLTAQEMFEHKEGNCLAFSILFASFARYSDIDIAFQKVHIPPSWNAANDRLFFYNQHVNIRVKLPHRKDLIIDIDQVNNQPHYPVSKISDAQVEALYYNNIGSQFLQKGDHFYAFAYLRKALELAPKDSSIWSNLGVLYRQKGLNKQAEQAYFIALKYDDDMNAALNNLSVLYAHIGEEDKADYYQYMVRSYRLKNPYYRYYKAQQMVKEQNYYSAIKHLKYAIRVNDQEPKFHELLAQINNRLNLAHNDHSLD